MGENMLGITGSFSLRAAMGWVPVLNLTKERRKQAAS